MSVPCRCGQPDCYVCELWFQIETEDQGPWPMLIGCGLIAIIAGLFSYAFGDAGPYGGAAQRFVQWIVL